MRTPMQSYTSDGNQLISFAEDFFHIIEREQLKRRLVARGIITEAEYVDLTMLRLPEATKYCTACKVRHARSDFNKNQPQCRDAQKAYWKEYQLRRYLKTH